MDSIFKQPPSASFQAGFKYTYMVKPVSTRLLTAAGQADGHSRAQSLFVRQCHVGCQCAAHSELHHLDSKLASPQTPVATASACRAAFCDARARSASTHTTTHHVQRTYRCGTKILHTRGLLFPTAPTGQHQKHGHEPASTPAQRLCEGAASQLGARALCPHAMPHRLTHRPRHPARGVHEVFTRCSHETATTMRLAHAHYCTHANL